ncbi:hypothetical protein HNQ98_001555 [Leuconostoc carnosum]|nr:hypothetical protein [Leuconostoc carnosum]
MPTYEGDTVVTRGINETQLTFVGRIGYLAKQLAKI